MTRKKISKVLELIGRMCIHISYKLIGEPSYSEAYKILTDMIMFPKYETLDSDIKKANDYYRQRSKYRRTQNGSN